MSSNDWISDLLARIRNAQMRGKVEVIVRATKLCGWVLDVFQKEGFIEGYERLSELGKERFFKVILRYHEGLPVIRELKRISSPGLRRYVSCENIPLVKNGLGVAVVSTPCGVLSDSKARRLNVGGEVLCTIF
jgi:small subunit ribosomal protein S8